MYSSIVNPKICEKKQEYIGTLVNRNSLTVWFEEGHERNN